MPTGVWTVSGWNVDDVLVDGDINGISDGTLDVGANGVNEWSQPGLFATTQVLSSLAAEFNTILSGGSLPVVLTDAFGNQFVDVPMKATATAGAIQIAYLDIRYDWGAEVTINPNSGSLLAELTSHVPTSGNDNVSIPIEVETKNAGRIVLSDINISYDARPKLVAIPQLTAYEDTEDLLLLDLSNYITDDNEVLSDLDVIVNSNSLPDDIQLTISEDNQYLQFTPLTENWNSEQNDFVYTSIQITDGRSRVMVSEPFAIWVSATNDEPKITASIGELITSEGGDYQMDVDTGVYFMDVEFDILRHPQLRCGRGSIGYLRR